MRYSTDNGWTVLTHRWVVDDEKEPTRLVAQNEPARVALAPLIGAPVDSWDGAARLPWVAADDDVTPAAGPSPFRGGRCPLPHTL